MYYRTVRVFLFLLLAPTSFIWAQTANHRPAASRGARTTGGVVHGTVKDATGAVIPNAVVTLTDQNGKTQTANTQADGTYQFRGVAPGAYTVSADVKGFTQTGVVAVMAAVGTPAQGDITMKVENVKQEVTIAENTTTQVSVDPSQNASALVLKGEDLAALPDDPDDLAADLQALAGPSAGPGGGQIYIDGFTGGRMPPKESIREIRINQNPFSAEYDRLGFGRIEILTKPGSDKFHGTGFYDISDGSFDARNPFLNVMPDFRTQRFGGNVSGPLGKHASFFVDVERRNIDDNDIIFADAFTNAGLPPSSNFFPTPQRLTTASPRVDWQLGANNTLSMRYSYWDSQTAAKFGSEFSLPGNQDKSDTVTHTAQLVETAILSPKVVNETHFEYRRDDAYLTAFSQAPQLNVAGSFIQGGSGTGISSNLTNYYELQNYTTVSQGAHSIKFGIRVRANQLTDTSAQNANGTYLYSGITAPVLDANFNPVLDPTTGLAQTIKLTSLQQYQRGQQLAAAGLTPSQIIALGGGASQFSITQTNNPLQALSQVDLGGFVQDDWRVAPNFTLSTGLRYETQTNIHDWSDFAPRVAIAWSPKLSSSTGRPKTVIRAGFGMFYQRFDDTNVLTTERYNGVNQIGYLIQDPTTLYPVIPSITGLSGTSASRYTIDPSLRAPYLIQGVVGVDQQLTKRTTLSVNYTNTRGVHQYRTIDINAPLPGTFVVGQPNSGDRPYGDIGDIYQYQSTGTLKQNQVLVRVNSQVGKWLSLFGAYIYSNAHSDTDGLGSLPSNPYDLHDEWGRSQLGITNRTFIGGAISAPWHIRLSPFLTARSGTPFSIISGRDNNGDGNLSDDRPGIASGPGPNIVSTPYGYLNLSPQPGDKTLQRNSLLGPSQFSVNLRISRTWGFGTTKVAGMVGGSSSRGGGMRGGGGGGGRRGGGGGPGGGFGDSLTEHRYNLTLSVSARNLFNTVNYLPPVNNIGSPNFLDYTGIAGGFGAESQSSTNRRIDIQLRFAF